MSATLCSTPTAEGADGPDREKGSKAPGAALHLLALGAILIASGALRSWSIGRESLWTDEALTLVLANWPVAEMVWYPADETPFLYYALHKLLIAEGAGAASARIISAIAGLLSVMAMYVLGRLALGRNGGLLCAALLAVWASHVDYSQEARAYSLLFFLTTVSAASLLWWFRETETSEEAQKARTGIRYLALALFALSTTLTFYTHLLSVIWIALALQILVSLTSRTRSRRHFLEAGAAMAVMALLAVPGAIRLVRKLGTPDAFHWLPQATPMQFVQTTIDLMLPVGIGSTRWIKDAGLAQPVEFLAAAATVAVVVSGLGIAWRRRSERWAHHLPAISVGLAFLSLPPIIWLFGYAIRPVFMPRTILFAIPGMILLLAASLGAVRNAKVRFALSSLIVGLYLLSTLSKGTVREKEDWGGANAFLARHARQGDLLLICPFWKFPAARHAMPAAVPVPALVPAGEGALLLERSYGLEARWAENFFDNVTSANRMLFREARLNPQVKGRVSAPAGASVWLVASECDLETEARIASWIGPGAEWEAQWNGKGASFRDEISIRRMTLAQPLVREVHLRGGAER